MEKGLAAGMEKGLAAGMQQGLVAGMEKGIQQGINTVAKNLKSQGISSDLISQCTGLSTEEIDEL